VRLINKGENMKIKEYKYKNYIIEKHIGGWVDIKDKKSYLIKNPKGEYVQSDYAHNRTDCDNLEWAKSKVTNDIWENSPDRRAVVPMFQFYIGSDIVATYQLSLYESSDGGRSRWEVQRIGSEKNQVRTFRTRGGAIEWCLEQLKIKNLI
tara:strand:+ start:3366 stop:3815 length:450 start_codon:yes stop_codon:yes gene_type:complete